MSQKSLTSERKKAVLSSLCSWRGSGWSEFCTHLEPVLAVFDQLAVNRERASSGYGLVKLLTPRSASELPKFLVDPKQADA